MSILPPPPPKKSSGVMNTLPPPPPKKKSLDGAEQSLDTPSPSSVGSLEEQLAQAPPVPAGATVDVPTIAPNIQAGTEQPLVVDASLPHEMQEQAAQIDVSGMENMTPEVGALESIRNTFSNVPTALEALPPKITMTSAVIWKSLLGEDLANTLLYNPEGRDVTLEGRFSVARLNAINEQYKETASLTDAIANGDAPRIAAAAIDAVIGTVVPMAEGIASGGSLLFFDMAGEFVKDYNEEKANALNISEDELYATGQESVGVPLILGTVAYASEKVGINGITNYIKKSVSKESAKKFALLTIASGMEGATENFQYGLEAFGKEYANSRDEKAAAVAMGEAMFSKEGLEAFAKGAVGGAGVSSIGSVATKTISKIQENKLTPKDVLDIVQENAADNGETISLIDAAVQIGEITAEQAQAVQADMDLMAQAFERVPAEMADRAAEFAPLIFEKAKIDERIGAIELEKATVDEQFAPMYDAQIEKLQTEKQSLNEKIQSLATPTVEQQVTEGGTVEGEVAGDGGAVIEGVQDGGVDARVEGTPLENVLNKRGAIRDSDGNLIEGDVYVDGERVVLEAGGKIYDTLGSIDELSQMTAEQLPVQEVAPRITANESGFTYNSDSGAMPIGTKITPQGKGLKAVKRDKDGNVKSVVVKDENGKTHNLKGEDAQAMAYELMMDEISKGNLDAKIVLNDEAANRINAAARPESTQGADSRTATQDATQQGDAAPARSTERGDGGRGSRGERVGKSKPKQDGKTTEQAKEPLLEGVRDGGEQSQVGQESAELRSKKEKEVKGKTKEAKDISEVEKRKADRKKAIEASQAKAKNALEKMKSIIAKDSNVGFAKTSDMSDARKRLKEDKEFFGAIKDYVAANIEMGIASTQQIFEGLTQQLGALPADFRSAVKDIFNREVLGAYKTTYNKLNTLEKKALDKKRDEARRKMVSKVRAMLKPQNFEYKSADKVNKARVFKEARQAIRAVAESLDGVDLSLLSDDALIELQDGLMELYDRGTTAQKFINDMVDMAAKEKGFLLSEFVAKKKGTIITNKDGNGALASLRTNSIVKYNGRFYSKNDLDIFKKIVEKDPDGNFEVIPRPASSAQAKTKRFSLLSFLAPELDFETLLRGIASDNASLNFITKNIIEPAILSFKNKDEANRMLAIALKDAKTRAFGSLAKAKNRLSAQADVQFADPDGKEFKKGGMNNAETLYVYMSVRQPDGFNRALAAGWTKEQLIELANYINSDSQLKQYANEYTDTFKIYLPKINEALEAHGFSSERFAEKKYDDRSKFDVKDAEKYGEFFEVLDAIYDGKIPEIVPYTPLSSDGINSNEKTAYDVMSTNVAGNQLSIISNNALLRESGGVLQVKDPDVLFKSYADGMTNMVAKLPLLKSFNQIFSDANINQIEDLFGSRVANAIKEQANDTLLGRSSQAERSSDSRALKFITRSNALVMFLNTRSAIFQQLSRANYAISAMESGDFSEYISNIFVPLSKEMNIARKEVAALPWVKERFESSASNIDLQDMRKRSGTDGFVNELLEKGYKLTQWSDVNAIVGGGTPYYKSVRDKEYRANINAGMTEDVAMIAAKAKASEALYITTQKTQQSSIEPLKSRTQKSAVARMILSFQTTNMQYTREMIKSISDIKNGRGNTSHSVAKILYYGAIQNLMFAAVSQAASFVLGDDEKEDAEALFVGAKVANTALNSIMRGFGAVGGIASVLKDSLWDLYVNGTISTEEMREIIPVSEFEKKKDAEKVVMDGLSNLAPPIGIKLRLLMSGIKDIQYREQDEYIRPMKGLAKIGQVATNIPLSRAIEIADQFTDAVAQDLSFNERILRGLNLLSNYEMERSLEARVTPEQLKRNIENDSRYKTKIYGFVAKDAASQVRDGKNKEEAFQESIALIADAMPDVSRREIAQKLRGNLKRELMPTWLGEIDRKQSPEDRGAMLKRKEQRIAVRLDEATEKGNAEDVEKYEAMIKEIKFYYKSNISNERFRKAYINEGK